MLLTVAEKFYCLLLEQAGEYDGRGKEAGEAREFIRKQQRLTEPAI
ncbi:MULTISPECIES: hypothetical protein [Microbulbifer]|nr:hypothetical protein [Microbulbifer zhoushanensis]